MATDCMIWSTVTTTLVEFFLSTNVPCQPAKGPELIRTLLPTFA